MFFYQLKILTKYYSNATLLEISLKCKSNFSKISKELRLFLLHLLHGSHLPHAPSSLIFSEVQEETGKAINDPNSKLNVCFPQFGPGALWSFPLAYIFPASDLHTRNLLSAFSMHTDTAPHPQLRPPRPHLCGVGTHLVGR